MCPAALIVVSLDKRARFSLLCLSYTTLTLNNLLINLKDNASLDSKGCSHSLLILLFYTDESRTLKKIGQFPHLSAITSKYNFHI